MSVKRLRIVILALGAALVGSGPALAAGVSIVAGENFYGDVAGQIAGPGAQVTSILSNPDTDPHLFEADPSTARAMARADIIIENGADYDPWMAKLLSAAGGKTHHVIVASVLTHRAVGANPHLWWDPKTMPAVARAIADELIATDPAGRSGYEARLAAFLQSLKPIHAKIATLRAAYLGEPVTATEPVFGYMATAVGLTMRDERFQWAVMNDTEPSAADTAAYEKDLTGHHVRLFIYNSQASDSAAERLLGIAKASGVPVIGVTETQPPGFTFQSWQSSTLDKLGAALAQASKAAP
jgi:zinc/manganese transport system substrate-binding protein